MKASARAKASSARKRRKNRKAVSLVQALSRNDEIQQKMERWADEVAALNEVLVRKADPRSPTAEFEHALDRGEELESNIQESAEALASINIGLMTGIADGKKLTRKLLSCHSQRKKSRQLSLYDALTGLPNRILFNDRLKQALAQAQRHRRGLALMFIDLDGFKLVNDSYGHDAGDAVLRQVAQRLQGSLRAEDTVSRRGGDEFVCAVMETNDARSIVTVAEKMITVISAATKVGHTTLIVKPSIGIAVYPKDGDTAKALIANADNAMYRAKRARKGYVFFSQLGSQ